MGGLGGDADIHILAEPHITVPGKSQSSLVVFYVNSTTLAGVLYSKWKERKISCLTLRADSCDGPISVRGAIYSSLYANTWK